MTDRLPFEELPRLLDAPSTDPALRAALRVVRDDAPDAMSLALLADGVQRAVGGTGAPHATTPASSMSAAGKTLVAAVVALAGAYGAYRLAAPPAERVTRPPVQATPAAALESPARPNATVHELAAPRVETAEPVRAPFAPPASAAAGTTPDASGTSSGKPARAAVQPALRTGAHRAEAARRHGRGSASGATIPASGSLASAPPRATPAAEDAAEPRQEDELMLLERAQRALQGDPAGAIEQLDEHRARFPSGAFAQEREALRIDALSRIGRNAELRSHARAFLERWPGSPHRARIQRVLDGP